MRVGALHWLIACHVVTLVACFEPQVVPPAQGSGGASSTSSGSSAGGAGGQGSASTGTGGVGGGSSSSSSGGAGGSSSASSGSGGSGGGQPVMVCPDAPDSPTMVHVSSIAGDYCIDSTEVTNAQYGDWLAMNPDPAQQIPECSMNATFAPSMGGANLDTRPVTWIDWCDAYAFCAAKGKRLCGLIGGTKLDFNDFNAPSKSQWFNACNKGNAVANPYPYGSPYDGAACNGKDAGNGTTLPVGKLSTCAGGFPGLFDMSGNVWEWEDACSGSGPSDMCRRRGGAFPSDSTNLTCGVGGSRARDYTDSSTGFRCCGELMMAP